MTLPLQLLLWEDFQRSCFLTYTHTPHPFTDLMTVSNESSVISLLNDLSYNMWYKPVTYNISV